MPFENFGFPPGMRSNLARRFSEAFGMESVPEQVLVPGGRGLVSSAAARAARRLSESALTQDMQVTFSRPDQSARRFVWIHLPFTNPAWVKVRHPGTLLTLSVNKWI